MTALGIGALVNEGGWPLASEFEVNHAASSCQDPLVIPIPHILLNAARKIHLSPREFAANGASFDLDTFLQGRETISSNQKSTTRIVANELPLKDNDDSNDSIGHESHQSSDNKQRICDKSIPAGGLVASGFIVESQSSRSDSFESGQTLDFEPIYWFLKRNELVQQESARRLGAFAKSHLPELDKRIEERTSLLTVFVWLACCETAVIEEAEALILLESLTALLRGSVTFAIALDVFCEFCRSVDTELQRPTGKLKGSVRKWAQEIAQDVVCSDPRAETIAVRILSGAFSAAVTIVSKALDASLPVYLQKGLIVPPPPSTPASTNSNAVSQLRLKLNLPTASPSEKAFRGEEVLVWLLWMMSRDGHLNFRLLQDPQLQERLWQAVKQCKPLEKVSQEWGLSSNVSLVLSLLTKEEKPNSEHEVDLVRLGGGSHGQVYAVNERQAVKVVECDDLHSLSQAFKEITILQALRGVNGLVQLVSYEMKNRSAAWITLTRAKCSLLEYRSQLPKRLNRESYVYLLLLFKKIVQALNRLADKLVLHNDLRCSNCLVSHDDKVLVSDFGEATILPDAEARLYEARGTEAISSPEMLRVCTEKVARQKTQNFDRRRSYKVGVSFPSDVWASGCLLFELICGGEVLYAEALDDWPRFFTRLAGEEETAQLDVIPEGRMPLLDENIEQENSDIHGQIQTLLGYILVRDERARPTPAAIVQRIDGIIATQESE